MFFEFDAGWIEGREVIVRLEEILIREDKHRHLVFVGQVKGSLGKGEGILNRSRREDDPWKFSVTCIKGKKKVALLGSGWQPCGRSRSLHSRGTTG
jgi:hypothetical protein